MEISKEFLKLIMDCDLLSRCGKKDDLGFDVEYVDSDLDEKAFVTAVITEGEFEACCNKIGVKSALRVLD